VRNRVELPVVPTASIVPNSSELIRFSVAPVRSVQDIANIDADFELLPLVSGRITALPEK
jgi:hypothetical protein